MRFSEFTPLFSGIIAGVFLLLGYFVQKTIEYKRSVIEKRREAYSMFFKAFFECARNPKKDLKESDKPDVVYWRVQVGLYGSDQVIRLITELTIFVDSMKSAESIPKDELTKRFDQIMWEMRKDTVSKTKISPQEMRGVSPINRE